MIKNYRIADCALAPVDSGDASADVCLYINPDEAEKARLRETFKIDEHTLSSALDPDEVSRIEFNPDQMLLIWKRPTKYSEKDTLRFDVASLGMLLFKNRLVIISSDVIEFPVTGARQAPPLHAPLDVMLGLVLGTIHHYLGHLKSIKMLARELQEKINISFENKHLIQMFQLSESLVYYINAIHGNGVVLTRLRNQAEKDRFAPEILAFTDDLIIENNQCHKQAEIYSTVFSGLMDARGNLVNNNMNTLLKRLTIINVVFLPLNLIASIGGMSEYSTITRNVDWRISYLLFCVAMLITGLLTAFVLKRIGLTGVPTRASVENAGVKKRSLVGRLFGWIKPPANKA